MVEKFESHIKSSTLFTKTDKLLLAISGGRDSMLMLHLLKDLGYDIYVAHCNFQLRGKDSLEDEAFIQSYCVLHKIPFFLKRFDIKEYSKIHKTATQESARNLRYNWFKELLHNNGFQFILTAHHKDDNLETILYNLIKGSKLRGYAGIGNETSDIIRPMLCYNRTDIDSICKKLSIAWREDLSNESNNYARNFLRNEIIPKLKTINPNIEETVFENSRSTHHYIRFLETVLKKIEKSCLKKVGEYLYLDIDKMLNHSINETILWELLKKYGFNYPTSRRIFLSLLGQSGKVWESTDYQILKDRQYLILRKRMEQILPTYSISIQDLGSFKQNLGSRELRVLNQFDDTQLSDNFTVIGKRNLTFPLTVRPWKQADKIKLEGIHGSKKVSDFLTDLKINLFEKEHVFVIQNGDGELISIDFYRTSPRYSPSTNASNNLIITSKNIF